MALQRASPRPEPCPFCNDEGRIWTKLLNNLPWLSLEIPGPLSVIEKVTCSSRGACAGGASPGARADAGARASPGARADAGARASPGAGADAGVGLI